MAKALLFSCFGVAVIFWSLYEIIANISFIEVGPTMIINAMFFGVGYWFLLMGYLRVVEIRAQTAYLKNQD